MNTPVYTLRHSSQYHSGNKRHINTLLINGVLLTHCSITHHSKPSWVKIKTRDVPHYTCDSRTWAQFSWVLLLTRSHKLQSRCWGGCSHLKAWLGQDPLPSSLHGFQQDSTPHGALDWELQLLTSCWLEVAWRACVEASLQHGSQVHQSEQVRREKFSSVQSLSHVRLSVTAWTAACEASLSITNSQRESKREVTVPYNLSLEEVSHQFHQVQPTLKKKSSS